MGIFVGMDIGRLREEEVVAGFDVERKFFVEDDVGLVGGEFVERRAFGVAVAAEIDGNNIETSGGHAGGEVVPNLALAIALVEKNQPWAGSCGREVSSLEFDTVGSGEVDNAGRGRLFAICDKNTKEKRQRTQEFHKTSR
jgi:hypothetical protein